MNAHSNDTGPHPDPNEELETPLTSQESISGRRVPRALGSRVVGMRGLALSWRGGTSQHLAHTWSRRALRATHLMTLQA